MFEKDRIKTSHTPAEPARVEAFCTKIGVELPWDYQQFFTEAQWVDL